MRPPFKYDHAKAEQAVLWFLSRHGGTMDKLKLIKLVFYADRAHLAKYGRPILGGQYCAMRHGPVLSELLDHVDSAASNANQSICLSGKKVVARTHVIDLEQFSESDLEVLKETDRLYGQKSTSQLWKLVHELKAYKKHYPDERENTSRQIPVEDLFLDLREEDQEILEFILDNRGAFAALL